MRGIALRDAAAAAERRLEKAALARVGLASIGFDDARHHGG
jgi:hypothetical protein